MTIKLVMNVRKLQCLCTITVKRPLLNINQSRWASTETSKSSETYATTADEDYDSLLLKKEMEIELSRNKSRLAPQHQNIINGRIPYNKPMANIHLTVLYKRKMFGRYGLSSNINPGTLWPTKSEIDERREYENIAYPYTVQQLVENQLKLQEEEEQQINERQEKILKNIEKLDKWKKDLNARKEKKLAEIANAKAKKDALIEEVRRYFGYKIDPKDPKFQEALVLKAKEHKKKLKEEKSKAKQEQFIARLLSQEEK